MCCLWNVALILWVGVVSIFSEEATDAGVDVVFLVDGSSESNKALFKQELLLIPQVVSQLSYTHTKIRFGLITYSNRATLQLALGYVQNSKALLHKLWSIKNSDSEEASLCYALRYARRNMFSENSQRKRFVIVFPNTMWNLPHTTNREMKLLKRIGVKILMVAIGDYVNKNVILNTVDADSIVYKPHITLNFIQKTFIYNFILNNIYDNTPKPTTILTTAIVNSTTSESSAGTTASSVNSSQATSTNGNPPPLSSSRFFESLSSTMAPLVPNTTEAIPTVLVSPKCQLGKFLVFAIDSCSEIPAQDFQKVLSTAYEMVNSVLYTFPKTRFGIVSYGDKAAIEMGLHDYKTKQDIKEKLKNIKQRDGVNNLGEAFTLINTKVFDNLRFLRLSTVVVFSTNPHFFGPDPIVISKVMKNWKLAKYVVIRIGNETNKWVDDQISTSGAIQVNDYQDLEGSLDRIMRILCDI